MEERADGANVNAWHWQETSRLAWSRQRLAELLTGLAAELEPSLGHARVTGVKDLTGEARAALCCVFPDLQSGCGSCCRVLTPEKGLKQKVPVQAVISAPKGKLMRVSCQV